MQRLIPFLLTSLVAVPAFAQDSDGDGVPNASDAFPCDNTLSSILYAPSANGWTMLSFEDQWPSWTDLDYNDVIVRTHFRFFNDAQGRVRRLTAIFDPVALGGDYSNGLAIQIPAARTVVTARRRVAAGAWQTLTLEPDQNATMILSANLRELFGNAAGPINSRSDLGTLTGQQIELEITFSTPTTLNTGLAPFDVFIFRAGDFSHQIHFPGYGGTQAMNAQLFGTDTDRSASGRYFLHYNGTPFALNLQSTTRYPLEGVAIDALFPNVVQFAASGGTQSTDFYLTNVVAAQGRVAPTATLAAEPAASTACVQTASNLVPGNVSNVAERQGFRAQCQQWNGLLCERMFIALPRSAIVQEAPCGVDDTTSLRPVWHGDTAAQCQTVCWIATGDPTCVQVTTSASSGSFNGWMYGGNYTVSCDSSGRQYSRVAVPNVGQQTWSFDSMSWNRSGSFSGYRCNW